MNKKKIFGAFAVLAIAAMAAFNVNVNMQEKALSDISSDNVEALASEYNGGTCGWSLDGSLGICNIRKDHVLELYYSFGGWWCCDSCSSTSYCGR